MEKNFILTSFDACQRFNELGIECKPEDLSLKKIERLGDIGSFRHKVIFRLACWAVKNNVKHRFIRIDGGDLIDKPFGAAVIPVQINDGFLYSEGSVLSFIVNSVDGREGFSKDFRSNCKYQKIKDRDDF